MALRGRTMARRGYSTRKVLKSNPTRSRAPSRPRGGKAPIFKRRARRVGGGKRYVRVQRIKTVAGNMSQSVLTLAHKPTRQIKEMKDVGTSNIYLTNVPTALQNITPGLQGVFTSALNLRSDMKGILDRVGTSTNGPRRFVLESVISDLTFTNQTSVACEVEIIDFACKRDLNADNWIISNGTTWEFTNDPVSVWSADANQCANTTLSPPGQVQLGAKPFDGQLFNDYFKALKRSIVMLPQGATHRHVNNLKTNRIIDESIAGSTYATGASQIQNIAGLTVWTMLIVRGVPVHVQGAASTHITSTANVDLAIVRQLRYKYTWVQDVSKSIYFGDTTNNDTGATVKDINIGSGQPESQQIAQ